MAQTLEDKRAYARDYAARTRDRRLARQRDKRRYRLAMIDALKDQPCLDCGDEFPPECMDFDHVRGEKRANVCDLAVYANINDVQAEIDKCELICANCHRTRTKARRATIESPITQPSSAQAPGIGGSV